MSTPAWMAFYPADYLADTGHLSTIEHGAYFLLILHYWRSNGLPCDDKQLSRIARMSDREWRAAKPVLEPLFGPGWTHKRIDSELAKATEKSSARALSGREGGLAKERARQALELANATDLPEQNPTDALASSSQPQPQPHPKQEPDGSCLGARQARSTPSRKRRLPDDADLTPAMLADALKSTLTEAEAAAEFPRFCDYHRANGSVMADWRAAWRTWCANAVKFAAKNRGPPGQSSPLRSSRDGQSHAPGTPGPITDETIDRLRDRVRSSLVGSYDPEAGSDQRDHRSAPDRRVQGVIGRQH